MKALGMIVAAALISISAIPHQVTHTRCAKLVAQDTFDRFEWVTRDGRRDDVFSDSCHPLRFTRAAMIKWPTDDLPMAKRDEP